MFNFSKKATPLLASLVLALGLGWIQYPNQPLSHGIGVLALVNQTAMLIQNLENAKKKEEKSLKG